jgi:hypothetical protein
MTPASLSELDMYFSLAQARSTSTTVRRRVPAAVTALVLACASSAWAQKITTIEELTPQQVLVQMTNPLGARPVGEAIALATALEIGTAPFGTSSGGFVFKLDPSTGLLARTTTTFGPSFTDRALTSGEGQVNTGVAFSSTTYDKLGDFALSRLPVGSVTATSAAASRTLTADLQLSSRTLALSGTVGVTENLDVGVVVPMVSVRIKGASSLVSGDGTLVRLAETNGIFSGIGDVSALAKFRFVKFKGPDLPDPGGVALLVNMRLPTGDRDSLRGLGITRTLVSVVASGGRGRLRPHANAGFEFWSKGVEVATNLAPRESASARHQIQYAAGVEIEATPKVTLLVDFLGQEIRGGGRVGAVTDTPSVAGVTSVQSMIALREGIRKALLVPGLKVNLKGKMLLSLNAIITMKNNGLHARVTPVVGINLTL